MRKLLCTALVATTLVACGGAPTRSGQTADPVTLSLVTVGNVGGDVAGQLATATEDLAVRVDPPVPFPDAPLEDDDAEVQMLASLRAGDYDISVIRTDILASAGAASLGVLQIPWLVFNAEQAERVAGDAVAEDLMAGLEDIGLVGLALVPGGLRHPFGYGQPLVDPAALEGKGYNTRHGDGVAAMVEALGATSDFSAGTVRAERVASGELRAIDTSLQQYGAVDLPAVLTSNVTLYTKFDVVVVRKEVWDGLTEQQQESLRTSAVQAGQTALAERDTEEVGLDRWCQEGGASSVVADQAQLDAWHAKLDPVAATAMGDPAIKALADRVAALGEGLEPPAGKDCGEKPLEPIENFQVEPKGDQGVLEGVWRVDAQADVLRAAGASAADAQANAGIWTIDITGHEAVVTQPDGRRCDWNFAFDGARVSIDFMHQGNDACFGMVVGTYQRTDDLVTFDFERQRNYDVALDNAVFAGGMHKIG